MTANWQRLYSIFDFTAQQIVIASVPLVIIYPNDAVARREFTEMIQGTPMMQHPDEYGLICIGEIDMNSGDIKTLRDSKGREHIEIIMTARETVRNVAPPTDPAQTELEPLEDLSKATAATINELRAALKTTPSATPPEGARPKQQPQWSDAGPR